MAEPTVRRQIGPLLITAQPDLDIVEWFRGNRLFSHWSISIWWRGKRILNSKRNGYGATGYDSRLWTGR